MEFLHMSKELNGLKWLGIVVTLFPNWEEFPRRCGQEDQAMGGAGRGPAEWRCDLAHGEGNTLWKL